MRADDRVTRTVSISVVLLFVVTTAACRNDGSSTAGKDEFCGIFGAHVVEFTGVGVGVEPEQMRAASERLLPALDELDEAAPAEIRDELHETTAFLREYYDILSRYGYDFDRLLQEGSADEQAALNSAGTVAAFEEVVRHAESECPDVNVPE